MLMSTLKRTVDTYFWFSNKLSLHSYDNSPIWLMYETDSAEKGVDAVKFGLLGKHIENEVVALCWLVQLDTLFWEIQRQAITAMKDENHFKTESLTKKRAILGEVSSNM